MKFIIKAIEQCDNITDIIDILTVSAIICEKEEFIILFSAVKEKIRRIKE